MFPTVTEELESTASIPEVAEMLVVSIITGIMEVIFEVNVR